MPLVREEGRELSGGVVGSGGPLDCLPVLDHDGIPVPGVPFRVKAVRGEGVEVQMRLGDLVASDKGTGAVAEFVVIVDITPVKI